jgi:hypothetical protein
LPDEKEKETEKVKKRGRSKSEFTELARSSLPYRCNTIILLSSLLSSVKTMELFLPSKTMELFLRELVYRTPGRAVMFDERALRLSTTTTEEMLRR